MFRPIALHPDKLPNIAFIHIRRIIIDITLATAICALLLRHSVVSLADQVFINDLIAFPEFMVIADLRCGRLGSHGLERSKRTTI